MNVTNEKEGRAGVGAGLRKSVIGNARLHKNVTKVSNEVYKNFCSFFHLIKKRRFDEDFDGVASITTSKSLDFSLQALNKQFFAFDKV